MLQGIILGIAAQFALAAGFAFVNDAFTATNQLFKTMLMVGIAGLVAATIALFLWSWQPTILPTLSLRQWLAFAGGALLALTVGETLFISAIAASNLTTVGYTALAYPIAAILVDSLRGKGSFTTRDAIGLVFLTIGFSILTTKK
jgi:drug/metabolite transporter (DMT)-like permease